MQADGAFLCLGQASAGLPTGFLSELDIGKVRHAKATWDFSNHSRKGDLKLTCGKIPSPSLCTEKGGTRAGACTVLLLQTTTKCMNINGCRCRNIASMTVHDRSVLSFSRHARWDGNGLVAAFSDAASRTCPFGEIPVTAST
jgi:hypothetical protein